MANLSSEERVTTQFPVKPKSKASFYTRAWGYIAAVALLPYALIKSIWAWGGTIGITTDKALNDITMTAANLKEESLFLYYLHTMGIDFTTILAVVASFFGLALVRSWGERIPHLLLVVPGWAAGLITLIAFISTVLQFMGVLPKGSTNGLALWVYILTYGGLFLWGLSVFMATLSFQKRIKHQG